MFMNDLIDQLRGNVNEHTIVWLLLTWTAMQALGRAYNSVAKKEGLRGIWRGLIFGTNTPKENNDKQ